MGSDYVDGGPSLGSVFSNMLSGMDSAPGKALDNMAKADALAKERALWKMSQDAAAALPAAIPEAAATPRPYTAADISAPAALDAPLSATTAPPGSRPGTFVDPRELAAAQARRNYLIKGGQAGIMVDPKYAPSALAYGTVGATGIPVDPMKRAELEFYTTGRIPQHIGPDETQQPFKNWVKLDENNQPIPGTAVSQRTQPAGYVLSSPVAADIANPIKDPATAQQGFYKLADKLVTRPETFTKEDVMEAMKYRDAGWQREVELRPDPSSANAVVPFEKYKIVPPAEGPGGKLMELLTKVGQPPAAATAPAATTPPPPPTATVDETGAPAYGATATTPPVPAPVVPPVAAAAARPLATAGTPLTGGNAEPLRKEYQSLPEVQQMNAASTMYNDIVKSAEGPTNNAKDLALVYSFIKFMDQMTGVREGEVKMTGQVGSWPDQVSTMLGRAQGKGMDNQTRYEILDTLKNRISTMQEAKTRRDEQYHVYETQNRLPPGSVVPPPIPLEPFNAEKIKNAPRGSSQPATVTVPNSRSPTRAVRGGGGHVLTPDEILRRDSGG